LPMPRRLFWLVLCTPVIVLGLVIADLEYRSYSRLEYHTNEVRKRYREAQARHRAPLFGSELPGNAHDLYRRVVSSVEALTPSERALIPNQAHSFDLTIDAGIDLVWSKQLATFKLIQEALRRTELSRSSLPDRRETIRLQEVWWFLKTAIIRLHQLGRDAEAMEWLSMGLGFLQDALGRDTEDPEKMNVLECNAARDGIRILLEHHLRSENLEDFASRLDALDHTRPSVALAYRLRDAAERKDALGGVLHVFGGAEPIAAGWRQVWLPDVARASALSQIELYYFRMEKLEELPPWQREGAGNDGPPWRPEVKGGRQVSNNLYGYEVGALTERALLRLLVAIAWCEVDTGTYPRSLSSLEPRYLPRLDPRPDTGQPWAYSRGLIGDTDAILGPVIPLPRRK